jgi:hypothetical protein
LVMDEWKGRLPNKQQAEAWGWRMDRRRRHKRSRITRMDTISMSQGDTRNGTSPHIQPLTSLASGEEIYLRTPDNPKLDGALATVEEVHHWGAHVLTPAAATGRFRALFSEMVRLNTSSSSSSNGKDQGFTGECCNTCGSFRMKRTGVCSTCQDCGTSGGCA